MQNDGNVEFGGKPNQEQSERKRPNYAKREQPESPKNLKLKDISFRKTESARSPYEMPDDVYQKQDLINPAEIKQKLDTAGLREMIETAVQSGHDRATVEDQIGEIADQFAEAKGANVIARELAARMSTKTNRNMKPQWDSNKNAYQEMFASFRQNGWIPNAMSSPSEVFDRINDPSFDRNGFNEKRVAQLANRGAYDVGMQDLLLFLNSSDANEYLKVMLKAEPGLAAKVYDHSQKAWVAENFRTTIMYRMVEGLNMIKTVAAEPTGKGRKILEEQFGLAKLKPERYGGKSDLVDRCDKTLDVLQKNFPHLYEPAAAASDIKKASDAEMTDQLVKAIDEESEDIQLDGLEELDIVRAFDTSELMAKGDNLDYIQKTRGEQLHKLDELKATIREHNKKKEEKAGLFRKSKYSDAEKQEFTDKINAAIAEGNAIDAELKKQTNEEIAAEKNKVDTRIMSLNRLGKTS